MLVPQSVEKRWGLEKNERLVLISLKSHRLIEIIKNLALALFCTLSAGLALYFYPTLTDQIYYAFWHHCKIEKYRLNPLGLPALMNAYSTQTTISRFGWTTDTNPLSLAVEGPRKRKINPEACLRKMLNMFFLAIRYPHIAQPLRAQTKECPPIITNIGETNGYRFATSLSCGNRNVMEDVVIPGQFKITVKGIKENISCFFLLDGHKLYDEEESFHIYTQKNFLNFLKSYLNAYLAPGFTLNGVYEAFKATFQEINTECKSQFSGTTFVGIFIINHILFCVSVGDSKAFLVDPFFQVPLSLPAHLTNPYFREKLEKRGASITLEKDILRVGKYLNMAAALGDPHIHIHKPHEESKPAIHPSMSFVAIPFVYLKHSSHIVLGSDGVFDHLSTQEIENILREDFSLAEKSKKLVSTAFANGSQDNLSAFVIKVSS